ncbi:Tim44/TimA family putative adaptor protein [Candidatus Bandiella euplotis]|nr:Tim44/TimA family putative adaptor protein [Candidatus Bandiella woodruffii]
MMELIFFAAIAAFVVYRLFATLGREEGFDIKKILESGFAAGKDQKTQENKNSNAQDANFEVISKIEAALSDNVRQELDKIKQKETFDVKTFIDTVKTVFEIVLNAFYKNGVEALKELLSSQLYSEFIHEIGKRRDSGLLHEVTLVGIKDVQILDVSVKDNIASIKVKIESDQIKVIKDKDQKIITGSVHQILRLSDIWTFQKDLTQKNYWELTETNSK